MANSGRNVCLNINADLKTGHVEGEGVAETIPKELLNLLNRYERRFQLNIELSLEVNLGAEAKPKTVFVCAKLDRKLKNWLITVLNEYIDAFI